MQKKLRTIEGFGAGVHDPGGEVHPPDSLCAEDGEAIGGSTGVEMLRSGVWRKPGLQVKLLVPMILLAFSWGLS